jgi:uncharacterized protein (TIGR00369 family)
MSIKGITKEQIAARIKKGLSNEQSDREKAFSAIDVQFVDCGDGSDGKNIWAEYSFEPDYRYLNSYDIVHGGAVMTAMDECTGTLACIASGSWHVTTTDFSTSFLRPMTKGKYTIHCEMTHIGRRMINGLGRVYNEDGKLCATSLGTYMPLQPE